jgi:2,3-bisphosphoglycerate-dependent phosphoglycerate mutase
VPGGETLKMVYERVIPFYKNTILPLLEEGKNVLLVAHGNSIRALMKYIESISDDEVGNLEMLFGQILVYDVDKEGHIVTKKIESISTEPPKA